jgi:2-polyprenyl-6-methoxyphenol hydroxylase-like FAD-dependent oxidoreductase
MKNKKILISGAGVAGLTLAYWLKQYGFEPTIVEKHPTLRTEGYKLDIRGAAVQVIKRMGLRSAIFEARTDIQKALFVDSSGKQVTETSPDLCGVRVDGDLEIVRGELCQILFKHIGGIECLFDESIQSISQNKEGVDVQFVRNGSRRFDLVIGADGLHSKVRKLAFGAESDFLRELGLYVSFYSIPNFLNLDRVEIEYFSPKRFAIAYCPRDGMAKAGFAFSSPPLQFDLSDQKQQQKFLQEAYVDAGWEIPRLLTLMKEAPDFYFDCMAQIHMPHWTKKRVALVGDAGYAVSPIAGQGTSVALVGAYVLAGELAKAQGEYVKAFSCYNECLREFVKKNQELAKMSATLIGASDSSWMTSMIFWLSVQLGRLLPGSLIQFCKKWGLRKTTKAANALTLKDYSTYVSLIDTGNRVCPNSSCVRNSAI